MHCSCSFARIQCEVLQPLTQPATPNTPCCVGCYKTPNTLCFEQATSTGPAAGILTTATKPPPPTPVWHSGFSSISKKKGDKDSYK